MKKDTKHSYTLYGMGIAPVMSISKRKFLVIFMRIFGKFKSITKKIVIFLFLIPRVSIN